MPLEAGLLWDELPIEILVPIIRVTAASNFYDFGSGISVERMSEQMQLTRAYRDHGTHDVSEYFLHQASHALRLTDFTLPNPEYRQRYWGYDVSSSSKDLIDTFFACLRILTSHDCGYAQVLFVPLGWTHHYVGNLCPLAGLTIRKYPPTLRPVSAIEGDTFPKLSGTEIDAVRNLFTNIRAIESSITIGCIWR